MTCRAPGLSPRGNVEFDYAYPETSDHSPTVTSRHLREFSGIWLVFFCGVAVTQWSANSKLAVILVAMGLVVGITGLICRAFVKLLFSVAMAIAFPIGWVITRLLLGFLLLYFHARGMALSPAQARPIAYPQAGGGQLLGARWKPDRASYLRQSL